MTDLGPQRFTTSYESLANDGNNVVVEYTEWHGHYLWEILSYSPTTEMYYVIVDDDGQIGVQPYTLHAFLTRR